jgi:heptosyltransferase-1
VLPRRILIVRLGAIGDVVNALVVAAALERHDPSVEIGWAVHERALPLVEGHPCIDRVHLWRRGSGLAGFRRAARDVRRQRYELAIDLQRIAKSAALARLSGAPRVLGFDRARAKEASWLLTREHVAPSDPAAHMVEQYLGFARHLGVPDPQPEFRFPHDPQAERWAEEQLERLGAPPVLVNLGASKPANRWAPERFGELVRLALRELEHPLCLTGGPDDRPAAELALRGLEREPHLVDLTGRTGLLELAALARRSAAMVACDTGPMHLAAAAGLRIVALFGAADPRRTGPWGPGHRIVRVPPPCSPCNHATCPLPRHECMDAITAPLVLDALCEVLAEREREGPASTAKAR